MLIHKISLTEKQIKNLLIILNNHSVSFRSEERNCIGYTTTINLIDIIKEQIR